MASTSIDLKTCGTERPSAFPFVSVVIPHFNDLQRLKICVESLHRQTWPACSVEIIVADNNSICGLDAVVEAAPGCRIVLAGTQGAGPARNAGVEVARGDILAFIDSDCLPTENWLEQGVAALADFDFVGGRVDISARNPREPSAVEAWEVVFGFDFERYILVEGYSGTGNLFVKRAVFDDVGGFRANVAEDMDWSFRARARGYQLGYAPVAIVTHPARVHWAQLTARWRRVTAEHFASNQERSFWAVRWIAWTAGMPFSIIPHTVRVFRSRRLPTVRSKVAAFLVLVRHRIWRMGFMTRMLLDPYVRRSS